MATASREHKIESGERPDEEERQREQVRRERIVGVFVYLGFVVVIGVLIWFARWGGTSPTGDF